jgi:hypothetical protein
MEERDQNNAKMRSASLYSPLQHRQDIRFMRIEPKRGGKCIEVTFKAFRIDSDMRFTALSYVWGRLMPQSLVVCNERDVPITYNS